MVDREPFTLAISYTYQISPGPTPGRSADTGTHPLLRNRIRAADALTLPAGLVAGRVVGEHSVATAGGRRSMALPQPSPDV